jgi:hypothetical protein
MTPIEHMYAEVDLDGIYESLRDQAMQLEMPAVPKPKSLNEKAMTVRLTTSKPRTVRQDEEAANAARAALGDNGITASTRLFKDPANPVRQLLNEVTAIYAWHKKHTIPYVDRGPRLLPVEQYEYYRDEMRKMTNALDARLKAVLPDYDRFVAADIAQRNGATGTRASRDDYPSADEFASSVGLTFKFAPLPDYANSLFDITDEERENLNEVYKNAVSDLFTRIQEPLGKLVSALNTPSEKVIDPVTGKEKRTGIFRDTKITNVVEAVQNVRSLSMGDPTLAKVCDAVAEVMKPIKDNPDMLREVPEIRKTAAEKLAEVQSRMAAFMGE